MIKLFIFDLGGVVVPASENELYNTISKLSGINRDKIPPVYNDLIKQAFTADINVKELYDEFCKKFYISDKGISNKLFESHMKIVRGNINRQDEILVNMIKQLKDDKQVVCLTNTEPEVEAVSREDGLYDHFHKAYTSTELKMKKPDPDIFHVVLEDQGVKAKEAVLIDDRIENILAANKIGMNAILYDHISPLVKSVYKLIKENNF